ncbi:ABC transporter permease subunit, partial [Thioclava sp. BHET1]
MTETTTATTSPSARAHLVRPPRSQWRDVWDQFKTHKGALLGAAVFLLIVAGTMIGPYLWPISPTYIDILHRNQGPTLAHPLGTDQLGRDLLARMMQGGRVSIAVGLTAMGISIVLGSLVGVLSGYFRRLDGPLMRLTDLFLALPLLPLLLLMVMLFRDKLAQAMGLEAGTFLLIVSAIGVTSWMQCARIVRG